jgi:DNA helicase II / ATP-dependent DNA helicase PcrA
MARITFNRTQLRAINYGLVAGSETTSPPLLILAGPGTGKTRVIARRANRLIESGAPAARILMLAFGNRAAEELRSRLTSNSVGGQSSGKSVQWVGTFHSVGARFIRRFARHVGLNDRVSILDKRASADFVADVIKKLPAKVRQALPDRDSCLQIYSLWVNSLAKLKDVLTNRFPASQKAQQPLEELFARYEAEKIRANSADFDDLLRLWLVLLKDPKIGPTIGRDGDRCDASPTSHHAACFTRSTVADEAFPSLMR